MANPFDQFDAAPAAPAKPARVLDRRPDAVQRAQEVGTVGTQTSTASTAQNIRQKEKTFPLDMKILLAQARRAELELAEKEAKLKSGDLSLTEQQSLSASRAENMAFGEAIRRLAIEKGYDPTTPRNKFASAAGAIPFAGRSLAALIRDPISEEGAIGEKSFGEGALRASTGAGVNKTEPGTQAEIYFPDPWSSLSPAAIKALDQKRLNQIIAQSQIAGPALSPGTRSTVKALTAPPKPKVKRNKQGLPANTSYVGILNPNK